MSKKRILTYGSLRKGEYNFERMKATYPDLTFIGTSEIKGYDLFDLNGSYPGIKSSQDPEKTLVVDMMECGESCFNSINRMELGANYTAETVMVNEIPHTIYVYQGSARKLVESGDWSRYLNHEQATEV